MGIADYVRPDWGWQEVGGDFYFEDDINQGIFSLNLIDSENTYLFVKMLFRKGPFGQFYGEDPSNRIVTFKVKNLEKDEAKKAIYDIAKEVWDVREI